MDPHRARAGPCDGRRRHGNRATTGTTNGGRAGRARSCRGRVRPPCMLYSRVMAQLPNLRRIPHLRVAAAALHARGVGGLWRLDRPAQQVGRCPSTCCARCSSGLAILLVYGWLERWPRRLPRWLPRTVLRLVAIVMVDADGRGHRGRHHGRKRRARIRDAHRRGTAVRAVDRHRQHPAAARRVRARAGVHVRAGAQRVRAARVGCAPAAAAGAGRAAFPVQHARERAGAGGLGLAAGVEGADEPHRLSTRGRAAHAFADHHARERGGAGARVSRSHADAHPGPAAVR